MLECRTARGVITNELASVVAGQVFSTYRTAKLVSLVPHVYNVLFVSLRVVT
jgi:hypothetical protein